MNSLDNPLRIINDSFIATPVEFNGSSPVVVMLNRLLFRILSLFTSVIVLLAIPSLVRAQSISRWTGAAGANWSTAANWDTPPVSNSDTVIVLPPVPQMVTTMNLASPLVLSHLQVESATTGSYVVNGGTIAFSSSVGNAVDYPTGIANNSPKVLQINTNLHVTVPITFGLNVNNPQGAEIYLGGALTGSSTISTANFIDPATNLVIRSRNNTGFSGEWRVIGDTATMLNAPNALFRRTTITLQTSAKSIFFSSTTESADVLNQHGIVDQGFNQQFGNIGGAGQFLMGGASANQHTLFKSSTVLTGYLGGTILLNGNASLSGVNSQSHFGKVGNGTYALRSTNNAFSAGLSVRSGTFIIETVGIAVGAYRGPLASTFTVYDEGHLRLNNAAALTTAFPEGRLGNLVQITTAGGLFRFDGSATASSSNTELLSTFRAYAGLSTVAVNANPAQYATLVFANFDSVPLARGGQVGFVGPTLGGGTSTGHSGIKFTTATALTDTLVGGILPWTLTQTTYTTNPTDATVNFSPDTFATYGANGLAPLTTFDDNNVFAATGTALSGIINSLILGPAGSAIADDITITSGAAFSRGNGTISGTAISTGPRRAYFGSSVAGSLSVTATLFTPGLSTAGTVAFDVIKFTTTAPLLAVNSGTLTLTTQPDQRGTVYQISQKATLNAPPGFAVEGVVRGNGTINGNVTIAGLGQIGGSGLAGNLSEGESPGTLTIHGKLTLRAGSTLRFILSSIHGDTDGSTTNGQWTQSKILAHELDLSSASASLKIPIRIIPLNLKNEANAPVYDFLNTEQYNWVIGTFTNGITAFASDKFDAASVETLASFTDHNPLNGGTFAVITNGTDLILSYTPAPEPAWLGIGAFAIFGMVFRLR